MILKDVEMADVLIGSDRKKLLLFVEGRVDSAKYETLLQCREYEGAVDVQHGASALHHS